MPARHPARPLTIGILAVPGVQMLDVAGPLDVFAEANAQSGAEVYRTSVISGVSGPLSASSGLRILADMVFETERCSSFDTLLVAGAPHMAETASDPAMIDWIRRSAPACRRFGSVCSGALLLAETGLLEGRRVTTHWSVAATLERRFPEITVEIDALHVRDGRVRTAAGVTAGLDLALALVEEDLGSEVAKRVAAQLVMFFKRPGGQLQFSRRGESSVSGRSALQEVQRWVLANPAQDARTGTLACRAGLSPRHFVRLFQHEIGQTPAAWVEAVRVDIARRMLEDGDRPKQVAAACGFSNVDTFRRVFQRHAGISPAEYRRRYEAPGFG
ncbi:GlxA family transcriptional regulator [Nitratireductor aquimarinus]|uniref:GlxA family transcriptional regulator n=1 Tax=Nitratireductor aquimarinus TaxID=889300 RepID=UPI00398E51C5